MKNNILNPKSKNFFLFLIFSVCIVIAIMTIMLIYKQNYYYIQAVKQAEQSAESYVNSMRISRQNYSTIIGSIVDLNIGITTGHDYKNRPMVYPNPATFHFDDCETAKKEIENFIGCGLFSDYSWPTSSYRDTLDASAQMEALQHFYDGNDKFKKIVKSGGSNAVFFAIPLIMQSSCVDCHNSHPLSPKTDWKVGDVRGGEGVIVPLYVSADSFFELLLGCLGLIIISVFTYFSFYAKNQDDIVNEKASDSGIIGLLNKDEFIFHFDGLCGYKNTRIDDNKGRLLIGINFTDFDKSVDNYGHIEVVDFIRGLVNTVEKLKYSPDIAGRYSKSSLVFLFNDIDNLSESEIEKSIDEVRLKVASYRDSSGYDIELYISRIIFNPKIIFDCTSLFNIVGDKAKALYFI
jgi:GGDEF domain-containing protein